jgi:ribonuclease E
MENMAKKMLIDATHAEETRVVVVDGNKVEEFDFESENKRQLAGNIYLAKVTRVEPSLQAAFVDYGGNRHGFLAFSEIHPDYYQIPVADREKLMEEERAYAEAMRAKEEAEERKPKRGRRGRGKAAETNSDDAVETSATLVEGIDGMETLDLGGDSDDGADGDSLEGHSPMMLVPETPVEEPDDSPAEHADDDHGDDDNGDGDDNGDDANDADNDDDHDHDDDDDGDDKALDATAKDSDIESVADDDDHDDIRLPRKPRARRYKIQEVIKVRQILLVQVVKEERGNKGAALTTYLSLAGRYCVLMPNTARGGGISRKITNAADRKKLKAIAGEIDVPQGAGLIVRTAGAKRTKTEIKRDYEYLQRLWEQIRDLTLKSIAPAKIYEEGNLIKRSIRDLYSREIDEVLVEGEAGYRTAKDFMKMIMPSHAKNVKFYAEAMPLFARYQVEAYLSSMFNPTVQLKSGGYIVIGVTEALVAIDVNSGRATKESSIEETATKTNLEAAEEVARQVRLRDLAGLIVIDFIDMDERRNNNAVEKRLKDKLKTDRARIQVGRISGFGLLEMSRQRLRPGMIEATTQPCPTCHGTGLIRSDDNLALNILRQIEEEATRGRSREVLIKAPVGIANFLMNQKREHVAQIEQRYGVSVRVEGDPTLISPDFCLEKLKTATRAVPETVANFVSGNNSLMDEVDDDANGDSTDDAATSDDDNDSPKPKKRRRRRRRRGKGGQNGENGDNNGNGNGNGNGEANGNGNGDSNGNGEQVDEPTPAEPVAAEAEAEPQKAKAPSRSRSRKPKVEETAASATPEAAAETQATGESTDEEAPAKPKRTRTRSRKAAEDEQAAPAEAAEAEEKPKRATRSRKKAPEDASAPAEAETPAETAVEEPAKKPRAPRTRKKPEAEPAPEPAAEQVAEAEPQPEPQPEPVAETIAAPDPVMTAEPEPAPKKSKRKGWWSLKG